MDDYTHDDAAALSPEAILPPEGRTSAHWTTSIQLLTRAITDHPDVPVNYLLRGEEWLVLGDHERARRDFEQVRTLAATCLAQSAWGYIHQAYIDRADFGLRQCKL